MTAKAVAQAHGLRPGSPWACPTGIRFHRQAARAESVP